MRRTHFPNMMTNYLHVLESGELKQQLKHHRNLYRYCCIGVEACIGVVRRFILNRTQRGGATGAKNDSGEGRKLMTNAKAVKKMMLRKFGRQVDNLSPTKGWWDTFYENGKKISNAVYSKQQQKRRFNRIMTV